MRHQTSLVSARPWGAQFPGFITVVCSLCMSTRTPSFLSCDRKTLHLGPLLPPNSSSSLPPVLPPLSRSPFPDFRSLSAFPFSILHFPFSIFHSPFSILQYSSIPVSSGPGPITSSSTAVHSSAQQHSTIHQKLWSTGIRQSASSHARPTPRPTPGQVSQSEVSIQGLNPRSQFKVTHKTPGPGPTDRPTLSGTRSLHTHIPTSTPGLPACQHHSNQSITQVNQSVNQTLPGIYLGT